MSSGFMPVARVALARVIARVSWLFQSPLFFRNRYRKHVLALRVFLKENPSCGTPDTRKLTEDSCRYFRRFYDLNTRVQSAVYLGDIAGLKNIYKHVETNGLEHIRRQHEQGAIIICYHIGPFTLAPLFLSLEGFNVNILVRPDILTRRSNLTVKTINDHLRKFCEMHGIGRVSFIDSFSMHAIVTMKKRLKKKELLMIYPDTVKDSSTEHLALNFFDTKIAGHRGLANLYRMTKPGLVPLQLRWKADGRMGVEALPPLAVSPDHSDEEIVRRIYGSLEQDIRMDTAQWIQVDSYEMLKI